MGKIIVQEFMTLDGVIQAPGAPEEDPSGDFKYGGWVAPYFTKQDSVFDTIMQKWMQSTDILLGRNTFQIWESYWPKHAEMWAGINEVTKYVMSNSLDHSDWKNSVFLKNVDDVKKLKASEGEDIKVHGSAHMAQMLFQHDLVDELCLMTFPIILGTGKRLFAEGATATAFELTDHLVTSGGVVFTCYQRAGEVETGTVGE
ncbi:dihydrofolate reductase family protein [Acinetobacter sp.]|uniref:dihydrofolate reductase family protein n=1 Tax=Acinetobacter sp. TaxID=472 RepID=UPI0026483978|nr:dihydrofolate reductase family protein [Acinetobacter sp.]MDN5513147.1 dihydrofolate reductase family protein [Acinetobacter sp.]MDN5526101.1 dihydrofolate reductase family protein [Acinetobacter sp.]